MLGAFTFTSIGAESRNVFCEQRNIRQSQIKGEDGYETEHFCIHIQHANPGYFLEKQLGFLMIQPYNEINIFYQDKRGFRGKTKTP